MKIKILICICSFVVSLGMAEIILKLYDIPKFFVAHSSPPQFRIELPDSGELIYMNTSSGKIVFQYDGNPRGYFDSENRVVHTTNSQGFRGSEFSYEKGTGIKRIAFLGDSFTFGEGVKDGDVFTAKIEKLLNRQGGDNIYQCLNFGVGGYNTRQSVLLLKNVVYKYKPDVVVLCYTLNDVEPDLFYYNAYTNSVERRPRELFVQEGTPSKRPPETILFNSRIVKLVWKAMNNLADAEKTVDYYHHIFSNKYLVEENKRSLLELAAFCRDNNIKIYIIILPLLYELSDKYPFNDLHQKIINNIPDKKLVVDALPYFMGYKYTDLWVHPTDQHPNEVAHGIIASIISERLLMDFMQDAPPGARKLHQQNP